MTGAVYRGMLGKWSGWPHLFPPLAAARRPCEAHLLHRKPHACTHHAPMLLVQPHLSAMLTKTHHNTPRPSQSIIHSGPYHWRGQVPSTRLRRRHSRACVPSATACCPMPYWPPYRCLQAGTSPCHCHPRHSTHHHVRGVTQVTEVAPHVSEVTEVAEVTSHI